MHHEPGLGLSFEIPDGWRVLPASAELCAVIPEDPGPGFTENVTIVRGRPLPEDGFLDREIPALARSLTDPVLIDALEGEVAGRRAMRLLVTHRSGPHFLTLDQWHLDAPGASVVVSFTADSNGYGSVVAAGEALVDTLTLDG